MEKPFPCIEATIDLTLPDFKVRVWLDRDSVQRDFSFEQKVVQRLLDEHYAGTLDSREKFIEALSAMPSVNAIQVIERAKGSSPVEYGTVVYTVPFEDVHG